MSFNIAHRLLSRTLAFLLVPAVFVVGANFTPVSKGEIQEVSFHKTTFKSAVTQPVTVVFEANEEFEDDSLAEAALAQGELSRFVILTFTREAFLPHSSIFPDSQDDHPLNSRAPPAV
ncbi:MAG: hypothetical protein KF713_05560 [Turneriella sp.]|nr:hypothetical protein [Turneriella sp.]